MSTKKASPKSSRQTRSAACSRRRALALVVGAGHWLPRALAATESNAPVCLAISQTVVGDVNLNDARAAMSIWIGRMTQELNVVLDPKLLNTTEEILDRMRRGRLDAVAVNIIEYRALAEWLDSSRIVCAAGVLAMDQYLILARQGGGVRQLGDLKGRRLCTLKTPKMCVAPDWLFTLLEAEHFGPADRFFGSMTTDTKLSRVILPVFFGQADACLSSKRGFETMCELNPQVGKDLKVIAVSPAMVASFYIFSKNCSTSNRDRVIKAIMSLPNTVAGRQLATLFQFENLAVRDGSCLAPGLALLEAADRARARRGAVGRKG